MNGCSFIAHRGASHAAPENTPAAFRLAWQEAADGIETDVHLTADGEVICFHDVTTGRVAGEDVVVAGTPWTRLAGLDVGSWKGASFRNERPPRLAEVFPLVPPGKRVFVEIKCGVEIVGPLGRALAGCDAERVVLMSFRPEVVNACRESFPGHPVHWVSSLERLDDPLWRETCRGLLKFTGATGLQFDSTAKVPAGWLETLCDEGYELTTWTVDDADTARYWLGRGVSNLTTNRPAALRAELLSAGTQAAEKA